MSDVFFFMVNFTICSGTCTNVKYKIHIGNTHVDLYIYIKLLAINYRVSRFLAQEKFLTLFIEQV